MNACKVTSFLPKDPSQAVRAVALVTTRYDGYMYSNIFICCKSAETFKQSFREKLQLLQCTNTFQSPITCMVGKDVYNSSSAGSVRLNQREILEDIF